LDFLAQTAESGRIGSEFVWVEVGSGPEKSDLRPTPRAVWMNRDIPCIIAVHF